MDAGVLNGAGITVGATRGMPGVAGLGVVT